MNKRPVWEVNWGAMDPTFYKDYDNLASLCGSVFDMEPGFVWNLRYWEDHQWKSWGAGITETAVQAKRACDKAAKTFPREN